MTKPHAHFWWLAVALLTLVAPIPSPPATSASVSAQQATPRDRAGTVAAGTAAVSGRVLVRGLLTPTPVRRARVTLRGEAPAEARTTDTDTDGRYRFDRLPAGA